MPRAKHWLAWLALALCLGGAGGLGLLYLTQDAQVYPRTINQRPPPNPALAPFQAMALTTPSGAVLQGIVFPATVASPTLVLAFAGNAHDVVAYATFLKQQVYPQPNVSVAGFAYRGYPNGLGHRSTGTPSEAALKADATFLHDALTAQLHPTQTIAMGYSLGSAVATWLATQRPVAQLVLIAPPASIRRLAQEQYPLVPVHLLLKSPWATEDIISTVTAPITILFTPTDGLIPTAHVTTVLAAAAPQATIIPIIGATHSTILDAPTLAQQLRRLLAPSVTSSNATPSSAISKSPTITPYPTSTHSATTP